MGIFSLFKSGPSKKVAKNRLEMVLVQDRSGLSSKDMEGFRTDLMGVMKKYFLLEANALEIEWKREGSTTAMVVNTALRSRPKAVKKEAA